MRWRGSLFYKSSSNDNWDHSIIRLESLKPRLMLKGIFLKELGNGNNADKKLPIILDDIFFRSFVLGVQLNCFLNISLTPMFHSEPKP